MARKAGGADQLAAARGLLRTAKTADELRTAQAVVLPLELGLSLEQTATAIGRSVGATCALRTRYCKVARRERAAPRPKRALRNRAHATLEREAQIIDEVLAGMMRGGVVVPPLKENVEERLGKPVALSTIYRMLARNGWRKLAPDTAHPQGDASAREDWKKTPGEAGPNRSDLGERLAATTDVSGRGAVRTHLGHPLLLVPPAGPTARERHGFAAIHLRVWRREPAGRVLRQPVAAACQFRMHAHRPRRNRQPLPNQQRRHGA